MKSTAYFTRTILTYLEQRAETDPLFAEAFAKADKNIDDCITYILNTVQKSGCNGFADEEIYLMATNYYKQDNINIGKPINARTVVNHVVTLTEEEKAEARQEAIKRLQNEAYTKMKQPVKKAKRVELNPQPTLFDF
ncbi:peptidyl-tRNA hydrolase [Dysgonomonas sp. PFB1-18]|uniref:PcfK-like family protein n=1 Tax=unclassified Dysgonomonas TaxID=2630389 RepID=UPI0024771F96|nr:MULTISPECIES: PcfK-like family protein [unclassified Dysgonomonas]MDH6311220.1 peptidyl-tRNA hydrolase [Dysgonomonas sp. PF1-14]MDH6341116.1 peptidyl-tRNA hydrolase [Dysgonomonas sp. PF1-16]MDH6382799.1 peptidyl-tRNA hydrolase [Dysgonomonas sp. PFB1-18]MDH6400085.1 peptidyl-tRNA hydrolase [Dysgonomonas sp. PF1-23]